MVMNPTKNPSGAIHTPAENRRANLSFSSAGASTLPTLSLELDVSAPELRILAPKSNV